MNNIFKNLKSWDEEYPYNLNASVLLLDDEIYNWKIGNQIWEHPSCVKMLYDDMKLIKEGRFKVENKSFVINSSEEHQEVFEKKAFDWFKNWKVSDKHIGAKCY